MTFSSFDVAIIAPEHRLFTLRRGSVRNDGAAIDASAPAKFSLLGVAGTITADCGMRRDRAGANHRLAPEDMQFENRSAQAGDPHELRDRRMNKGDERLAIG
jgi:hypothetical protein